MFKKIILYYFVSFSSLSFYYLGAQDLSFKGKEFSLEWNINKDAAVLMFEGAGNPVWKGSLLPVMQLMKQDGNKVFIKPGVLHEQSKIDENIGELVLDFADLGEGKLKYELLSGSLVFRELQVTWNDPVPMVVGLYFGMSKLAGEQERVVPDLSNPFWPDWIAEGYCVPGAKGAPIQSFFRRWDFGHATIPLGNFGPSMGTPYAAAFPKPVYSMAMGDRNGWIVLGAGDIPLGAMSLNVKSSAGAIEYLFREDLWGAEKGNIRVWKEHLRLTWADNAWDAFSRYFDSFDKAPVSPSHQRTVWNTWGDWRRKDFDIQKTVDFALNNEVDVICFDDPWELFFGSDEPNMERFPSFFEVIDTIKAQGKDVGIWQTVGWIEYPEKMGLTEEDLLIGVDGKPRKAAWTFSAEDKTYYCIDPSSERARQYLRNRTHEIIKTIKPALIKLDFAYGLPPPDVAAPRKPQYRGEKYAFTLFSIIADAAHEIDPDITIQYYSIHPLHDGQNLLSLDDLGDAWLWENKGHDKWSIWAAQAGLRGAAITASSGYDWDALPGILLNCAVLGAPGAVLSSNIDDTISVPSKKIALFKALARWHRKTTGFIPLWLNSETGGMEAEPALNCWGRVEVINNDSVITALTLREEGSESIQNEVIRNLQFSGNWALISQENQSIFNTLKLACIPFGQQATINIPLKEKPFKVKGVWMDVEQEINDWQYNNGELIIHAEQVNHWDTFMGFVVETKNIVQ